LERPSGGDKTGINQVRAAPYTFVPARTAIDGEGGLWRSRATRPARNPLRAIWTLTNDEIKARSSGPGGLESVRQMTQHIGGKMARTVLFDRALAALPVGLWAIAPLFVGGLVLGLVAHLSPISALVAAIVLPFVYRRNRARHETAVAEGLAQGAQPQDASWQPRLGQIKGLVRELATQMGVSAPVIEVETGGIEVNMRVFSSDGGAILLVNESMLRENLSAAIDADGLRGNVAHEMAHLRAGRGPANQLSAALRALQVSLLAASVAACGLAGAPIGLLAVSMATMAVLSAGGRLARRREEIEANLVAARMLGTDGPRTVLSGFAQASIAGVSLAYAIMPVRSHGLRLRATLLEATGLGATGLRASLEAWPHEDSFEPDAPLGLRERAARLGQRLVRPFSDHPGLASLAVLLGVERQSDDPTREDLAA
jgi:Zn-dependent protease with chaperone function